MNRTPHTGRTEQSEANPRAQCSQAYQLCAFSVLFLLRARVLMRVVCTLGVFFWCNVLISVFVLCCYHKMMVFGFCCSVKPCRSRFLELFRTVFFGSRFLESETSGYKARLVILGHLDPDAVKMVAAGKTASPTASPMARSLALQLMVSNG